LAAAHWDVLWRQVSQGWGEREQRAVAYNRAQTSSCTSINKRKEKEKKIHSEGSKFSSC